jgi:hypothetical protein
MTATEIHSHLLELETERVLAILEGLGSDPAYMAHLTREIDATLSAYIGTAVTEIAVLRAELSGRLVG